MSIHVSSWSSCATSIIGRAWAFLALPALMLCAGIQTALAQSPVSDFFDPGADNAAFSLAVQVDGKVLAGGAFMTIGGEWHSCLARLLADGTPDPSFNPYVDSTVHSLAVQADGKILVGGEFTYVCGEERHYLARLNADGTLDMAFNPGADGVVYSLVVQADGEILVGGEFTHLCGAERHYLARLYEDGTLDTAFNPDADNAVYALAVQDNGRILTGGVFTWIGGGGRTYGARLYANGTLDAGFNPGADDVVYALAVQADGKVLLGGEFSEICGAARGHIARMNTDGTLDTAFNPGADAFIQSLTLQADGKILAGGWFSTFGGAARANIGRLNGDGTLDADFNPGANGGVYSLMLQADGKILASGGFTTLGGESRSSIGRLNNTGAATETLGCDGTTVTWLRGGTGPEVWRTTFEYTTNGSPWALLGAGVRTSGGWELGGVAVTLGTLRARGYTVGGYNTASGGLVELGLGAPVVEAPPVSCTNVFGADATFGVTVFGSAPFFYQWRKDGVKLEDSAFVSGATTEVLSVLGVSGESAGGYDVVVSNAYGCVRSAAAVLTVQDPFIDGQPGNQSSALGGDATFSVSALGTGLSYQWRKEGVELPEATDSSLTVTAIQASDIGNYDVVISGTYGCVTSAVVLLEANLAVLDAGFRPNANSTVMALAVQPDGKILVGGDFTMLGRRACTRLARLSADGSLDMGFNPSVDGSVTALAVQTNGQIVVGGWFTRLNGVARNYLARLNADGTLDASFNPDANSGVGALALQADGRIVVGGNFTQIGGVDRNFLARLDADGALDTGFDPNPDNVVLSLAMKAGGEILVGGWFSNLGEESHAYLARLGADGIPDSTFNPNIDAAVDSMAVQSDGRIVVGGEFTHIEDVSHNHLARLHADGTLDGTFTPNADGAVQSVVVQADGKVLVGGLFYAMNGEDRVGLARLEVNGTMDAGFNPGTDNMVEALALQADGRILLGGFFSTVSGEPRTCIARLVNTAPATGTLSYDESKVTWLRGGSAPEVWRTTFEYTVDGASWTLLGEGTRVTGGWELGWLSGTCLTLRARGFTAGGYANGSGGLVEALLGAPLITVPPASCTNDAGTTAKFSVTVSSPGPFWCQWLKDGVPLADVGKVSGATTATVRVSGVVGIDAGAYNVIVGNANGSVTSVVAVLTVVDPVIASEGQPANQLGQLGGSVVFGVSAAGSGLRYQWRKDGVDLAGATNALLTLNNLLTADEGRYDVVVSSTYGSVISDAAELAVNVAVADTGFNNVGTSDDGYGSAAGNVYALAVQPDGKILVGGKFETLGGEARKGIARLNADGTLDAGFSPEVKNGLVQSLAVQADGKILVGGYFFGLGDSEQSCIGRLNTNGTVDASFAAFADSTVRAQLVQADGKILMGGDFTYVGLSLDAHNSLARLNTNGTPDTTFNLSVLGSVYSLAMQTNGQVWAGGYFSRLNGYWHYGIGCVNANGSVDDSFDREVNGAVCAMAVQADGKTLVGGSFDRLNSVQYGALVRLCADGSVDPNFSAYVLGEVDSLVIQADGKILLAGSFGSVNGTPRDGLARLNADGTLDDGFNPGGDYHVNALALQADGKVLVGGGFALMSGGTHYALARLCNTVPATASLTQDLATVTWVRGGSSPEVWRTTFEYTTNGSEWVSLGQGVRIPGGWQADGLPTQSAIVRVRGYAAGGAGNGSCGIVEAVVGSLPTVVDSDGDGIPDWWTAQYFGHSSGQSNDLSRASDDASGSGQNNLFKYVAGLDPTNIASVFRLSIENVFGEPTQKRLVFSPRWADRTYEVLFSTNLIGGSFWTNVTDTVTGDSGSERAVTDLGAAEKAKFYRVRITAP